MLTGTENRQVNEDVLEKIKDLDLPCHPIEEKKISDVKAFGLNYDFKEKYWQFSYYIGLDYLDDENKYPIYVSPKIPNLDYLKMFQTCLEHSETAPHLSNIYDIRIDKPVLEPPDKKNKNSFILLIMHHYLTLLSKLVKNHW